MALAALGIAPRVGRAEKPNQIQCAAARNLYTGCRQLASGTLKVSDVHTLYFETFGNPRGQPAVFLHGGPGAGCTARHAQFFDPEHYFVVLFDQRGCGKSTPRGCLHENTTWDLVDDLEKLRNYLGIERWAVLGGSWGVTLALAYAESYPTSVLALVLRGVCLFRPQELEWLYKQGASFLFPFSWSKFLAVLEPEEQIDVLGSYYRRLTSDNPSTQLVAAQSWLGWEMALSFFAPSQSIVWDGKQYSMSSWGQGSQPAKPPASSFPRAGSLSWCTLGDSRMPSQVVQARLECYYSINRGFFQQDQLLHGISRIRHIPCVIVHGRFDFVCPLSNVFDLHRAWPEAELRVVSNAGHSMYDTGVSQELVRATDSLKIF